MRILLADDDRLCCENIAEHLENRLGHQVTISYSGLEALKIFKREPFPMVLTDIFMPEMNGIELLNALKALDEGRQSDIVIITGLGSLDSAIASLRAGAYDYLQKPINYEELDALVRRIVEHQSLKKENYELTCCFEEKVAEATGETKLKLKEIQKAYAEIVGIGNIGIFSEEMHKVMSLAYRMHEDREVPVLIEGETGTGKEIIARLVHFGQGGVSTPFISINCSAISPNLFETELFGYASGAFTGANATGSIGKLELAKGGTIFLDEIGDLPAEFQPKLLRVLQEREIYRVGGLKRIKLDVRFIFATNRNLWKLVEEGVFRRDLFYRLNLARIYIPPLKERRSAIRPLARMFLEQCTERKKKRFETFRDDTLQILENHSWPGNIRELQNIIEQVVLLYDDVEVRPEHLALFNGDEDKIKFSPDINQSRDSIIVNLPEYGVDLKTVERDIIRKILARFNGNKTLAAEYFGFSRSSLRRKLEKNE